MSKKRAKLMRQVNPIRELYRMDFPNCALCGKPGHALHEISSGPAREESLKHPEAWIHLCTECHLEKVQGVMSIAAQLALKCIQSPEYFDRRLVAALRGRAPDSVRESEVVLAAFELGKLRGAK